MWILIVEPDQPHINGLLTLLGIVIKFFFFSLESKSHSAGASKLLATPGNSSV
ncbi:hypothetical protein BDV29DRAFT_175861 [Aspergillus leporis]|uniref:Uncharacterized protein n=1 Tax=Aspergillus leporis TaxID=41062 RepID=A0A5N5WXD3_9EURO|nr:hypothetical protein BDV29DRAFT_175861 [Aspergillus leporis]